MIMFTSVHPWNLWKKVGIEFHHLLKIIGKTWKLYVHNNELR